MAHAYLALDQGTTSSRAVVYDDAGGVLAQAQHEFGQHYPQPGWVEHDAEEILATTLRALAEAWDAAGKPSILGVGISNQRETVVLFDRRTLAPLHRAIVWQDRRTAAALTLLAPHAEIVRARAGLPLDPYFSAAKIAWLLDHVPGARARAERGELGVGTIDAWLVLKLTGGAVFATEPSNASRTSLFDLHTGAWSEELCGIFGVPPQVLPRVQASASDFGTCVPGLAGGAFPIRGVLGDQQAALFGHGGLAPGATKCTYGTGAFLLCNAGPEVPTPRDGLLATVAWQIDGAITYALEGSVMIAGAAVQWLRDGLGIIESSAAVESLAREVADSGGVVFVPAFAGLGTPEWDPHARGLIVGITRGTTRAHLARATLEGIAAQVREVQLAFERAQGRTLTHLRVDGGAAANDLLLEIQADLSKLVVERSDDLEATARGAMRIAMLGVRGGDPASLPAAAQSAREFAPSGDPAATTALWRRWRAAVARARGFALDSTP